MKNIDKITGHFLLSNDYFLASIDDKVASLVIGTLSLGNDLCLGQVVQSTEFGPDHDGYFSNWDLLLNFTVD